MLVAMSPPSRGIQCVDAGLDSPDGMAVVANLVVKEDRKADRQSQAGQASIDHDHDGCESSLALSMAL
jgi:hypothetical protein